MDSPLMARLFRELFRRPACQFHGRPPLALASSRPVVDALSPHVAGCGGTPQQTRAYAVHRPGGGVRDGMSNSESKWQQRTDIFPDDRAAEFDTYAMVTAEDLRTRKTRPRKVKMLMRDFIDDSLYNPSYGYFSKEAVIFSPGEPFAFDRMRDNLAFYSELSRRYTAFEDALDATDPNPTRQLWHTPTELFRPHYGEAIARYLVSNYRLTSYPYHDLTIYEMGAGNGTLMRNILDYIRDVDPAVYTRTKYRIIEISPQLAALQASVLAAGPHAAHVDIVNRSIFDWTEPVSSPCFFLAMEVWDNFAHDAVRYDPDTEQPLQAVVLIDGDGEFFEFYTPQLDARVANFFRVRQSATGGVFPRPYPTSRLVRHLQTYIPLRPNLSDPEYIPTQLMEFFRVLETYFPRHRLVASDFHALPDAVQGLNAPVVQTRFERTMIPVTTPLVHQGYFDILFPTDFRVMESIYRAMTGKFTRVSTHEDFMRRWAYIEDTETRSGENPLLDYYKNASVLVTL
ncbi:hypothetical protein TD95_000036 [Thielaviopsis punctulata]|uniref:Protein arginine methyltransferase NDUFAF7 n=1 Tax=Thielaviopsis punctulata TaxID=72032 RepID=A0A0F4Z8Q7_9PEZI|nr:hypothetical protein TD95_000036 [Thielaviopsis punctulata]